MAIAEDIEDELEAIAEERASPIYAEIKNVSLLGRALLEIRRLYTKVALLEDDNEYLSSIVSSGAGMLDAQRAARANANQETIRAARLAEDDFESKLLLITELYELRASLNRGEL